VGASAPTAVPRFACNLRFRITSTYAIGSLSFEADDHLIDGLRESDGKTVQHTPGANAVSYFSNDHASPRHVPDHVASWGCGR
jgi:hypothetical protein